MQFIYFNQLERSGLWRSIPLDWLLNSVDDILLTNPPFAGKRHTQQ
jgi:hypothetical protein